MSSLPRACVAVLVAVLVACAALVGCGDDEHVHEHEHAREHVDADPDEGGSRASGSRPWLVGDEVPGVAGERWPRVPPPALPEPGPVCPVDRTGLLTIAVGDAPVVVVAAHAGVAHPDGCDPGDDEVRPVGTRTCTPDLDACASGPCRAGGIDRFSREITLALVDALGACLGRRPSLVIAETSRVHVDVNRDALDPAGPRCAYEDPAALPLWQDFHDAVAGLVVEADRVADHDGTRALLLDVHTHASLAAAPAPAVLLGSGLPFGTTMPGRAGDDASLAAVFGENGLRARVLRALAPRVPAVEVWPRTVEGAREDLFNGRTVVHRYGTGLVDGVPPIDALQLEASDGVRDDPADTARAFADALCATLLADAAR